MYILNTNKLEMYFEPTNIISKSYHTLRESQLSKFLTFENYPIHISEHIDTCQRLLW